MEVKFNEGQCSICRKYLGCSILGKIRRALNDKFPTKYEYIMEMTIQKCIEFEKVQLNGE